ncbi:MAG TPA: hypothetical protein VGM21_09495 [Actinomycetota bacterium]|jgi:hypothetical protein
MPHHDPWSVLKVRLYPDSLLEGHADQAPVVARHLAPGLLAVVARDLPETVEAVGREQAAGWGVHDDELFRLGYGNVAAQDRPLVQTRRLEPGFELTTLSGESFFTTTNALWPDRYVHVFPATGALVGVPHRHMVLVHPIRDFSALYAINLMIPSLDRLFRQGPGSLSPMLYWWRPGSFTLLPGDLVDQQVRFSPPSEFVHVLNRLAQQLPDSGPPPAPPGHPGAPPAPPRPPGRRPGEPTYGRY